MSLSKRFNSLWAKLIRNTETDYDFSGLYEDKSVIVKFTQDFLKVFTYDNKTKKKQLINKKFIYNLVEIFLNENGNPESIKRLYDKFKYDESYSKIIELICRNILRQINDAHIANNFVSIDKNENIVDDNIASSVNEEKEDNLKGNFDEDFNNSEFIIDDVFKTDILIFDDESDEIQKIDSVYLQDLSFESSNDELIESNETKLTPDDNIDANFLLDDVFKQDITFDCISDNFSNDESLDDGNKSQINNNGEITNDIDFGVKTENQDFTIIRKVYAHPRFLSEYKKVSREKRIELDNILSKFKNLTLDELRLFLKQNTNKFMKGNDYRLEKLYVSNNLGDRLLWCYGKAYNPEKYESDSIIILSYIKDHDLQGRVAKNINKNIRLEALYDKYILPSTTISNEGIPPYLYINGEFLPQMTSNQEKIIHHQPPLLIQGCAGSGKTQISLFLFDTISRDVQNSPIYITFTKGLVNDVKKKYQIMNDNINARGNENIMTVNEFFCKLLNYEFNSIKYFDYNKFKIWKDQSYKYQKKFKDIDSLLVWTFIRGIIKGGASINGNVNFLEKKDFYDWVQKNERINPSDCELIYKIAVDYQKYCSSNNILDDNDLAIEVLSNQKLEKVSNILIIDEVQDLTYNQIKALIYTVKNQQIYFCGDPNQKINPTIIDLDSIGRYMKNNTITNIRLENSFRSGKGVIKYINYLSQLRCKYIAKQDSKNEIPDKSLRDEENGLWVTRCIGSDINFIDLFETATTAANTIMIVPNEEVQQKLVSKHSRFDTRVRTIYETKGLEYDNVIIYNFLTENVEGFKKIVKGEARKDTFGRLLFNMLYVASTRVRERLIICEDDACEELSNIIYKDIIVKKTINDLTRYLDLVDDPQGWYLEAKKLEDIQDYRSAKVAYMRTKDDKHRNDITRCDLYLELERINSLSTNSIEEYEKVANQFLLIGEYKQAYTIFTMLINNYKERGFKLGYLESKQKLNLMINYKDLLEYLKSDIFTNFIEDVGKIVEYAKMLLSNNSILLNSIKELLS